MAKYIFIKNYNLQYIFVEKPGLLTPTMTDVEIADDVENDIKSEKKLDSGKLSYEEIINHKYTCFYMMRRNLIRTYFLVSCFQSFINLSLKLL